jgi:hypothetical protein
MEVAFAAGVNSASRYDLRLVMPALYARAALMKKF